MSRAIKPSFVPANLGVGFAAASVLQGAASIYSTVAVEREKTAQACARAEAVVQVARETTARAGIVLTAHTRQVETICAALQNIDDPIAQRLLALALARVRDEERDQMSEILGAFRQLESL